MIKGLERSEIEGPYLNIGKAMYNTTVANVKQNVEKIKAILLISGTRVHCPLTPYMFNIVFEVLAIEIWQQKEVKEIQIRKEEIKVSLFADDMRVYLSDPINYKPDYELMRNHKPGNQI